MQVEQTSQPLKAKETNIRTTNIVIDTQKINYDEFHKFYEVYKYELPKEFIKQYNSFKYSKNKGEMEKLFQNLHFTIQESIDLPYFLKTYYSKNEADVYVVVGKNKNVKSFHFLEKEVIATKATITDLNLYYQLRLLLANFFYEHNNLRICQDEFFVFSEANDEDNRFATALEISLGAGEANEGFQEIKIEVGVVNLVVKQVPFKVNTPLYEKIKLAKNDRQAETYFKRIKRTEVEKLQKTKNVLWAAYTSQKYRGSKTWWKHINTKDEDDGRHESSACFIIDKFHQNFIAEINKYFGNGVASTKRFDADRYTPENFKEGKTLPLEKLPHIHVFDLRMKRKDNETALYNQYYNIIQYVTALNNYAKEHNYAVNFVAIAGEHELDPENPTLVLLDVSGKEFEEYTEDGEENEATKHHFLHLAGLKDPKKEFYREYADQVPLQSMIINPHAENWQKKESKRKAEENDEQNGNSKVQFDKDNFEKYFEYKKFTPNKHKFAVCLNELFLKNIIVNELPIMGLLPYVSDFQQFMFLHKNIFLYVDDNFVLKFVDIREQAGKMQLKDRLLSYGIDWSKIRKTFEQYEFNNKQDEKTQEDKDKKLSNAYFVFSKAATVFDIKETGEKVMFGYDLGGTKNIKTQAGLQDICYNQTKQLYTVGQITGLEFELEKAVLVRKLHLYENGTNNFDFIQLLPLLGVNFVRHKQYTVFPYPFDLIRLYKEIKSY